MKKQSSKRANHREDSVFMRRILTNATWGGVAAQLQLECLRHPSVRVQAFTFCCGGNNRLFSNRNGLGLEA